VLTIDSRKSLVCSAFGLLITTVTYYLFNVVLLITLGARDGPAHLDQIAEIKKAVPHITIIANGNVRTYEDVVENQMFTGSDGIMAAEGLLDDPALFVRKSQIASALSNGSSSVLSATATATNGKDTEDIEEETQKKKQRKSKREKIESDNTKCDGAKNGGTALAVPDKLALAVEYLDLVRKYPVKMKSVVFHIRRIIKDELNRYQLLEDCVASKTPEEVRKVVLQAIEYRDRGDYVFDPLKEKRAKEAIERRKRDEGKRKAFEERMMRKAKREGKEPFFYLAKGSEAPTAEELAEYKKLSKEEAFAMWKERHSQHCYAFHFDPSGCARERTCSFLHADASYSETVAYG
jgi:tRNA-dihydrouridine synthase